MAESTGIEWADSTFNPWIGCTQVSPACDNCYAAVSTPERTQGIEWGAGKPRIRTSTANWAMPLRWERDHGAFFAKHGHRQRVFCASLADVFDNEVPDDWRDELGDLIQSTPNLNWMLLTKRIGNAAKMLFDMFLDGAPSNLHLGATICNQFEADRDVQKLIATPVNRRFLSVEPMLDAVDIKWALSRNPIEIAAGFLIRGSFSPGLETLRRIDLVIAGGESGPHARPSHPYWFRSLRDQCAQAGVPFMFKQWGEYSDFAHIGNAWNALPEKTRRNQVYLNGLTMIRIGKKGAGRLLDGVEHNGRIL